MRQVIRLDGVVRATTTAAVVAIAALAATKRIDPGRIPYHPPQSTAARLATTSTTRARVRGVDVHLKPCATCGLLRPPRAAHCRVDNRCIERFDHRCGVVGATIGRRNLPSYLLLLAASAACSALTSASLLSHLASLDAACARSSLFSRLRCVVTRGPLACVLLSCCSLAAAVIGVLLSYQTFLVTTNQTTREHVSGQWRDGPNPFDRGALSNWREVLACARVEYHEHPEF